MTYAASQPCPGRRVGGRGFSASSFLVVLADDVGDRAIPVWLNGAGRARPGVLAAIAGLALLAGLAGPAQLSPASVCTAPVPGTPGSACGEPFGGGSGGVGCAAQEAGQELEVRVVVPGADLVDRGVHAGVGQVKAQDFGSAAAGRLDDDAAAVGGVAAALDPAAAFEPVEDAGQGGGVEPVMDPASIAPAIDGADAVLSAVGPRGTGPATVIQDSVHSIIQAMRKTGTRRLLQVSGSVVADDGESPYLRYLLKPLARRTFLRHACAGMRRGEQEIRDSDLDWTIFRPPSLTGKPATGAYRTAIDRNLPHGLTVSRADLAACMLASLSDPATVHRHLAIAS